MSSEEDQARQQYLFLNIKHMICTSIYTFQLCFILEEVASTVRTFDLHVVTLLKTDGHTSVCPRANSMEDRISIA